MPLDSQELSVDILSTYFNTSTQMMRFFSLKVHIGAHDIKFTQKRIKIYPGMSGNEHMNF